MHVFYIHSHITYVIARLFIAEQKLSSKKVRYITSRGYALEEKRSTYDITDFYNYLEQASRLNKVFYLNKKIKALDRELHTFVNNEPFTAYVPQYNHSLFQIITSHRLCKYSILVEEGITSYKMDKALYMPTKMRGFQLLSRLFSKRFILQNNHYRPFPLSRFKYAITIDQAGFPFMDRKRVVAINKEAITGFNRVIADDELVFVLDSFKERAKISEKDYFKIIEETLNLLKSDNERLLVKFHPEQQQEIRQKTLNFIKETCKFQSVVCLSDNCILELEFITSKHLIVIGMHTSLLYYAKKFGHHVISSIKITSKNHKIDNYINHIMDMEQREIYKTYE